jgi:thioredoxin reductase (NADPH)
MENRLFDVLIIGGGPAGCSAAIYASRARLDTLVIDKDPLAGALAMAHKIANYPGITEEITGQGLLELMKKQAESFGAGFVREKVSGVVFDRNGHQVFTASGNVYMGRAVILATGSMGRSGELPGEKRLLGQGVSYCATCDAAFYKDRVVAVYGKTREAAEEALLLSRFASKVYLLVPGNKLLLPEGGESLTAVPPNVEICYETRVRSINGARSVESLTIEGPGDPLAVEGVFIYVTGSAPVIDYLGGQLELTESGCLMVDRNLATAVPGVFAAGDLLCKEVKQAVIVAAEGCRAALHADKYLRGRDKPKSDYN